METLVSGNRGKAPLLDHQTKPLETGQEKTKLRLVEHYAIPMEGGRLQIWSATQRLVLSGGVVTDLLPTLFSLLDGSNTRIEILKTLGDRSAAANQLLDLLQEKGLIEEVRLVEAEDSNHAPLEMLTRYFRRQENPEEALRALRQAHALIVNAGPVAPPLVFALGNAGIAQITIAEKINVTGPKAEPPRFYASKRHAASTH